MASFTVKSFKLNEPSSLDELIITPLSISVNALSDISPPDTTCVIGKLNF